MHRRTLRALLSIGALAVGAVAPLAAQTSSADYTEPYQVRAHEIYRDIIAMRTAAGHGMVDDMAEYLANVFIEGGFPAEHVHILPHTSFDGEPIPALVVQYPGDGSSGERPILFTGHMDVVDALPEDWVRDPFTLIEEDGYFFGRGTFDDKFGIAMLTATFLRLKAEGFVPTRDLVIGFTGDEETAMLSTRALVNEHRDLTDAEFALNADAGGGVYDEEGNPVSYLIQIAEKTYATFEITVTNPGGHSSQPRLDNAIYELASALQAIEDYRFPVRINEATRQYFERSAELEGGEMAEMMRRFAAGPDDREAADFLFEQPGMVGVTRTTCVATMLRGGHAENALPQSATATVNCRIWPGDAPDDVGATLESVVGEGATVTLQGEPGAAPPSPLRDDVMDAVRIGVDAMYPDVPIIPYQAPYATDGFRFREAGIPTYGIMGLFIKGSDEFAHGLDERVEVRTFFAALEFWKAIIDDLAGRPVM